MDDLSELESVRETPGGRGHRYLTSTGLQEQRVPEDYIWDGRRRGGRADRPFLVVQVTLRGWGAYRDAAGTRRLLPGDGFVAVVPGDHCYYLPSASPGWMFFFLCIAHPYVAERVAERQASAGPFVAAEPGGLFLAHCLALFRADCVGGFPDGFAEEQAVLEWLIHYERLVHRQMYPPDLRDQLLDRVAGLVSEALPRPLSVEEVAARFRMSRSHFSHHFRRHTGLTPAVYMGELRLREAARRLRFTDAKLERIAAECGFADANHLCKVFRRGYHTSPGAYRRQFMPDPP